MSYIANYHPQSNLPPTRAAVQSMLAKGWVAQRKVDGWRAQIHVTADHKIVAFTRNGNRLLISTRLIAALKQHLRPGFVVEGEWVKSKDQFYAFDVIARDGQKLTSLGFRDRYDLLPRVTAPLVQTLPLIDDLDDALAMLEDEDELTEGLVFRDPVTRGFSNDLIWRCRRYGHRHA